MNYTDRLSQVLKLIAVEGKYTESQQIEYRTLVREQFQTRWLIDKKECHIKLIESSDQNQKNREFLVDSLPFLKGDEKLFEDLSLLVNFPFKKISKQDREKTLDAKNYGQKIINLMKKLNANKGRSLEEFKRQIIEDKNKRSYYQEGSLFADLTFEHLVVDSPASQKKEQTEYDPTQPIEPRYAQETNYDLLNTQKKEPQRDWRKLVTLQAKSSEANSKNNLEPPMK